MIENVVVDAEVDGQPIELALWRTPAMEEYDRLRPLNYIDADVILICFGIDRPESLDSVTKQVFLYHERRLTLVGGRDTSLL